MANVPMTEKTGLQMVQDVLSNEASNLPASKKKEQITVLDIAGSGPRLQRWVLRQRYTIKERDYDSLTDGFWSSR